MVSINDVTTELRDGLAGIYIPLNIDERDLQILLLKTMMSVDSHLTETNRLLLGANVDGTGAISNRELAVQNIQRLDGLTTAIQQLMLVQSNSARMLSELVSQGSIQTMLLQQLVNNNQPQVTPVNT